MYMSERVLLQAFMLAVVVQIGVSRRLGVLLRSVCIAATERPVASYSRESSRGYTLLRYEPRSVLSLRLY